MIFFHNFLFLKKINFKPNQIKKKKKKKKKLMRATHAKINP